MNVLFFETHVTNYFHLVLISNNDTLLLADTNKITDDFTFLHFKNKFTTLLHAALN